MEEPSVFVQSVIAFVAGVVLLSTLLMLVVWNGKREDARRIALGLPLEPDIPPMPPGLIEQLLVRAVDYVRYEVADRVFGRLGYVEPASESSPDPVVAAPVADVLPEVGQLIAMPGNAINEALTDQRMFDEKIRLIAEFVKAGLITNQAIAIEKAFGCTRSGRPESTYGKAHAALKAALDTGPQFRPLDDRCKPVLEEVTT